MVEASAQLPGFNPHDVVFSGIIPGAAPKDVKTDLLFVNFTNPVGKGSFANVQKELTQPSRLTKLSAGRQSQHQFPSVVFLKGEVG
jgi:hypothetical protein